MMGKECLWSAPKLGMHHSFVIANGFMSLCEKSMAEGAVRTI